MTTEAKARPVSYKDKIIELGYDCYLKGGNSIGDNPFPTDAIGFELFLEGFNQAEKDDKNNQL